jgi:two-component system OmpR family response regulator
MKILLVEDDRKAARLLTRGLREEGFEVEVANCAEEAAAGRVSDCDLVILDWMLPGKDGISLCRQLRAGGVHTPILMLTARDAVADRIAGLNTGADDYLTKPFAFDELLARVHALLRRARAAQPRLLQVADLVLNPQSHAVRRGGIELDLTPKEYMILEFLLRNNGDIISRGQLAEHVWQADLIAIDNLIDVHIKNLRRKVDLPATSSLIHTIRGRGFCLSAEVGDHA